MLARPARPLFTKVTATQRHNQRQQFALITKKANFVFVFRLKRELHSLLLGAIVLIGMKYEL